MTNEPVIRHYFVDEAGDLTLFGRRGKVLVGQPGCSKFFMLAVAQIQDPDHTSKTLQELRERLLADPYFKDVPSMQPSARKTALFFHATDDLPEVRREVFKVLPSLGAKVQVAIRRKTKLVSWTRLLQASGKKLDVNMVYDDLVKRLFRNLQHKADVNKIVFARRGKSARSESLHSALAKARLDFRRKWQKPYDNPPQISSEFSYVCAGLQVVDYYLWALRRLYERGEDRFFELLRPSFRVIMDLDDKRNKGYGEWYTDANPLTPNKIKAF